MYLECVKLRMVVCLLVEKSENPCSRAQFAIQNVECG
jgi:hypothetical protein